MKWKKKENKNIFLFTSQKFNNNNTYLIALKWIKLNNINILIYSI
jgi:hypothetical protein